MEVPRVVVVGSVNVDLVVVAPRLPRAGETVSGGDVARHQGGKGGNQAVAAARLGARVAFVGAVGSDDLGTAARDALAAEGIAVDALARVDRPTGVALIVVDPAGENLVAVAPGANGAVTPQGAEAALRRLAVGPGDVVLVVREIPPSAVRAALATAREAGATTILNPAPADGVDAATLQLADVLTPNETELALITGEAQPEPGARMLLALGGDGAAGGAVTSVDAGAAADAPGAADGPATADGPAAADGAARGGPAPEAPARQRFVAVTLGADGALLVLDAGPTIAVPAPTVRPVDTTGAGDTFNGALAAGLAAGLEPVAAVRRAVAAAALSTTRPGARDGMPTLAALEEAFPKP